MWWLCAAFAFPGQEHSFTAYGGVPTWTGVVSDVHTSPTVHIYDSTRYPGHAEFVSRGLRTGLRFAQFKDRVKGADRTYLPFFLYELDGSTWAIRIEDYGYVDPPETLCKDVVEVANKVADHIGRRPADGILVLATSDAVRPNRACSARAERAGFTVDSLGRVQRSAPASEVLHPGLATGRVRFVEPGEEMSLGPRDIAVFSYLPERVPPVAAIVTTVPQTPLSHLNLLARNRGTPNLYIEARMLDRALRDCDCREGWVALDASKRWELKSTSDPGPLPPRAKLSIPVADRTTGWTDLSTPPGVARVGAKANNYARLRQRHPDLVRPAHAIGFELYFDHVENGPARERIEALLSEEPRGAELDLALADVRTAIRSTPLDPATLHALHAEILTRYRGKKRVRLRSSTNAEDLPRFNGAGLYVSKGFDLDDSPAKLEKKIKKVFASLWSRHAYEERSWFGIDHRHVGMALLVHQAFRREVANGVALVLPGDPPRIHVDIAAGESSVVRPEPGTEIARFDLDEGSRPTSTNPSFEAALTGLQRELPAIHTWFTQDFDGFGTDIEFKVMNEGGTPVLFLKQIRLLAPASPE